MTDNIQSCIKMIKFYDDEIAALKSKQSKCEVDLLNELTKITGVEHPVCDTSFWGWDCPDSPAGKCVYDSDEDPAWDNCIFCHEPSERK